MPPRADLPELSASASHLTNGGVKVFTVSQDHTPTSAIPASTATQHPSLSRF